MKLPIVGAAYKHPSIDVNNQRCLNMLYFSGGPDVDHKGALMPTDGAQLLINLQGNSVRCIGRYRDNIYVVVDDQVYKLTLNILTESATLELIGTIPTSTTGTMYMAANVTQIMWVDGSSKGYIYTPGTGVFEEITNTVATFTGGGQVVYIDGYFVVNDPDTGNFYFSEINNGLDWDPLSVATAESAIDNVVGLGITKGELWVFGTDTIEVWYDAANVSGCPFSPRTGLGLRIGCGASASIVEVGEVLIWLDNRGYIVQSEVSSYLRSNNTGYDLNIISTEALTAEILGYSRLDDAIAMSYNSRGHLMYQITFPSARKTWVYDQTTQTWHERAYYSSYEQNLIEHLGQYYARFNNLHIMGGINSGKIYLAKSDVYTDDSVYIRRIRSTPVLYEPDEHGLVCINKLELRLETGRANANSPGNDPYISMRYSNDGGHTWSNELVRSMGQIGEYNKSITWNRLGVAREWMFEFLISDPVAFSIIEGFLTVTPISQ